MKWYYWSFSNILKFCYTVLFHPTSHSLCCCCHKFNLYTLCVHGSLTLSYLGFINLLEYLDSHLSTNVRSLGSSFLKTFFPLLSLFPWDSHSTYVINVCWGPIDLLDSVYVLLFIFLSAPYINLTIFKFGDSFFYFPYSVAENFYWIFLSSFTLTLKLQNFSSVPLHNFHFLIAVLLFGET